jgi:hypothetical protein
VSHLLTVAEEALEAKRKEYGKNVIDPFSAMFEMAGFGLDHAAWVNAELMRQAHRALCSRHDSPGLRGDCWCASQHGDPVLYEFAQAHCQQDAQLRTLRGD